MKKTLVYATCLTLLMSSCGTYTGSGAYVGTSLGAILGSAIGGIANGPRGSDVGTIVGMVGGAVVGGAIGSAADAKAEQQRQADLEQYRKDKAARAAQRAQRQQMQQQQDDIYGGNIVDETNSGDDRIYDFTGSDYDDIYTGEQPVSQLPASSSMDERARTITYSEAIQIRNARFIDDNGDNIISRNEISKVIFELVNQSNRTLFDIQPIVVETTGNRHLYISPGMHIERLEPGKGIRYTAMIKADNRLKNGSVKICISAVEGNNQTISRVSEFNIATRK